MIYGHVTNYRNEDMQSTKNLNSCEYAGNSITEDNEEDICDVKMLPLECDASILLSCLLHIQYSAELIRAKLFGDEIEQREEMVEPKCIHDIVNQCVSVAREANEILKTIDSRIGYDDETKNG
jgi:hypothetical protein